MPYYIDLQQISIHAYKEQLRAAYLPPSRMILKEQLHERFAYFEENGIQTLKELQQKLKQKKWISQWEQLPLFSNNYMAILLREINSIQPKPNAIADFIGVSIYAVQQLKNIGITNTQNLYVHVLTKPDRQQLAQTTGIEFAEIVELTKLTDLSRIKWVGATYARLLYDIGVATVAQVAASAPEELHVALQTRIREHAIFKGGIGIHDVKILIESARMVPLEIQYDNVNDNVKHTNDL